MLDKQFDIAFLHTGEVHVANFESLVASIAPSITTHHVVKQSLLTHAIERGEDDDLKAQMHSTIDEMSLLANVVVCTCSSIGGMAEALNGINQTTVQRIDRAMANKAIKCTSEAANNVLVVAALESTIQPTLSLLQHSASVLNMPVNISHKVIPNAWQHFEQGSLATYRKAIARYLNETTVKSALNNEAMPNVIVLAQASMAGCEGFFDSELKQSNIPVLSSPNLGVKAAISALLSED